MSLKQIEKLRNKCIHKAVGGSSVPAVIRWLRTVEMVSEEDCYKTHIYKLIFQFEDKWETVAEKYILEKLIGFSNPEQTIKNYFDNLFYWKDVCLKKESVDVLSTDEKIRYTVGMKTYLDDIIEREKELFDKEYKVFKIVCGKRIDKRFTVKGVENKDDAIEFVESEIGSLNNLIEDDNSGCEPENAKIISHRQLEIAWDTPTEFDPYAEDDGNDLEYNYNYWSSEMLCSRVFKKNIFVLARSWADAARWFENENLKSEDRFICHQPCKGKKKMFIRGEFLYPDTTYWEGLCTKYSCEEVEGCNRKNFKEMFPSEQLVDLEFEELNK